MAINPESQYPGKIAPATPQYPYGAARNITVPGDGTGTPWEAAIVNDLLGFQQALLSGAAVVPSGTPDEVGASQYLEALQKFGIFLWTAEPTYQVGAIVVGSDGSLYVAKLAQSGNDPVSDGGTNWGLYLSEFTGNYFVSPFEFGAVGDGVADDNAAVAAAIATGKGVWLGGPDNTFLVSSLTLQAFQKMSGLGARLTTVSNQAVLNLSDNSSVEGIVFEGDGRDSGSTSQVGINIDGTGTFNAVSRTKVLNCDFVNLAGSGWRVTRIVDRHQGNVLTNCTFESCNIGVNLDVRGEYNSVTNCSISLCNTGVRIQGGNNTVDACSISDNVNEGVLVLNGSNDAHGHVTNCLINHNTNYAVKVEDISVNEFSFHNCKFYDNDIWLFRCAGVRFYNCTVGTPIQIYEQGCTNCYFMDCMFFDTPTVNENFSGENSEVFYINSEWNDTVATTSQPRINGAFSEVSLVANTIVPIGVNYEFAWDNVVFNAIANNLAYAIHDLWNAAGKYWDYNAFATAKADFFAKLHIQLSIGAAGSYDDANVDVYMYNVATGRRVGQFAKSEEINQSGSFWRIYTFNGTLPKGLLQIRIDNNTAGTITVFREQGGQVPCGAQATGW